ncbi:hypothetical protein FQV07_0016678, partial [Pygoscelis papua]
LSSPYKDTTVISKGNALADAAAKAVAHQAAVKIMAVTLDKSSRCAVDHPKELYQSSDVTSEEKEQWKNWGAVEDEDGIWTIGGKPVLLKKYLMTVTRWFHDKAHGGMEAVANQVQQVWAAPGGYAAAKKIINTCPTYQKFSNI